MPPEPLSSRAFVIRVQRFLLGLRGPRSRRAVELGFRGIARGLGRLLTRGLPGAATYVRGGLATGDFRPGLSDIDLALVLPGAAAAARARRRSERLRRLPGAALVLDEPRIYDERVLRDLAGASAYTYGLGDGGRAGYLPGDGALDRIRLLERPGLHGPTGDWRLLDGPDLRPRGPERDAQERRIAAWLELAYWWRLVARYCINPDLVQAADVSVKLVAEPARIWLWLVHGERATSRTDALQRALRRLPEEEPELRLALDLQRALSTAPAAPLARILPATLRLSERIAGVLADAVDGSTEVRLGGAVTAGLPLADWRSIVCPEGLAATFVPLDGAPADPGAVAAAATAYPDGGPCAGLRSGSLLVLPAVEFARSRLRVLKCPVTDPVPFALLDGAGTAVFPELRGWSARDTALRAVAEHRARLAAGGREPGLLRSAARAALFLQSIDAGDPELCLTAEATAERLGDRDVLRLPAYR